MAARRSGITLGDQDPGWDAAPVTQPEETSANYRAMHNPPPVTNMASLKYADPALHAAIELLMVNLKLDMLPDSIQEDIVDSMSPTTKRSLVQRIAGLDASVLVTFKAQLALIDAVTRRVVTPEGVPINGHGLDIGVKDAMNMSLKVIGILVKDMPKVINLARVQRLEDSLLKVVETLPKKAQDEVLRLLEEEETKAAREAK